MKQFVFVILLSLALTAQVKKVDETTIVKMQQSSFGKNMLSTIALQLKTNDSADDLIEMLRNQEDKL